MITINDFDVLQHLNLGELILALVKHEPKQIVKLLGLLPAPGLDLYLTTLNNLEFGGLIYIRPPLNFVYITDEGNKRISTKLLEIQTFLKNQP